MAKQQLILSHVDVASDGVDEVVIEIHVDNELIMATYVVSTKKDGIYDKVGVKADINENGDITEEDEAIILQMANAFSGLAKFCA